MKIRMNSKGRLCRPAGHKNSSENVSKLQFFLHFVLVYRYNFMARVGSGENFPDPTNKVWIRNPDIYNVNRYGTAPTFR